MAETLRDRVSAFIAESSLSYRVIATQADVPYGALYHFATRGEDMRSEYMEKLYIYFTKTPLIDSDDEG